MLARGLRSRFLVAVAVATVVAASLPARAADNPPAPDGPTIPAAVQAIIPGLDPAVVGLPLNWGRTSEPFEKLTAAEARRDEATTAQAKLEADRARLDLVVHALSAEQQRHTKALAVARRQLDVAVAAAYKSARSLAGLGVALDADNASDLVTGTKFSEDSSDRLAGLRKTERDARHRADAAARAVADDVADNRADLDVANSELESAKAAFNAARNAVGDALSGITARGTDLPVIALDAYVRAERVVGLKKASCGLRWWMLAGIGKVESNHGRFAKSNGWLDGTVNPPIYGVALDGAGVALIGDTDGGLLDADPLFDRAIGPMQFIPGSWKRWAADGNGDDLEDPQNLYDAAQAAGFYLCARGRNLADEPSLVGAYLSYNNSLPYAAHVLELAHGYRDALAGVRGLA